MDFQIKVQTASLTASLGPVVRGITGKRTPAGVRWTADVSAAGDGIGLTYAWTFTDDQSNAGTFSSSTTNPTILTSYEATVAGTVKVTVTDAAGLTATASLPVPTNLFPVLPLAPAKASCSSTRSTDDPRPAAPTPPSSSRS